MKPKNSRFSRYDQLIQNTDNNTLLSLRIIAPNKQ